MFVHGEFYNKKRLAIVPYSQHQVLWTCYCVTIEGGG